MGIVDYKDEMLEIKPVEDLAQTLYNKQVGDITNISHLDGYKEIKRYWKAVKDGAEDELKTIKAEYLTIVQLKYSIANGFVTFLENLEITKEISEKVKKAP